MLIFRSAVPALLFDLITKASLIRISRVDFTAVAFPSEEKKQLTATVINLIDSVLYINVCFVTIKPLYILFLVKIPQG